MKKNTLLAIASVFLLQCIPAHADGSAVAPVSQAPSEYQWSKFSLGVSYVNQQQDYELNDVSFRLPPMAPMLGLGSNSVSDIENTAETYLLRFSYTPHPLVTFFAVAGHVDGEVDVSIVPPVGDITVDYDGIVYGGGVTLNYAYRQFFVSLTGSYTIADLDDADIDTLVVSPKIGMFNDRGAIWIGAQYQRTEHSQSGSIGLPPLGQVTFNVDLEDEKNWGWLVGGRLNLSDDLALTLEAGFADRKQVLVSLEKKF
ncbi:MAG: hypothetical protein AB8F34_03920 [Akkermansiaceae bacterium]